MKKIKENRCISFVILFVVYFTVSFLGVYIFNLLDYNWIINLLIADLSATIIVYFFSLIFNNASIYDPYWSVQPIIITFCFSIGKRLSIEELLLLFIVIIWGVRLTINFCYTFKDLYHQDWRYTLLKEKTKKFYPFINLLGMHLFPTVVVYLCVLPVCYVLVNDVLFSCLSLPFIFLSFFAVAIQAISDIQMHKYRNNRTSTFIRNGLWKYSRHPNYLGEILMWWGVGLYSFVLTGKWYLLTGAFVNMLMFIFISVPLAEGRQSKKEGFYEYKKVTRMFLPIKK